MKEKQRNERRNKKKKLTVKIISTAEAKEYNKKWRNPTVQLVPLLLDAANKSSKKDACSYHMHLLGCMHMSDR